MLPSYYEFFNPVKILSGHKALDNLPYELDQLGARQPLVVTDQGVVRAGLVRHVTAAFDSSGMSIGALFDEVPPDSSSEVVNRIAALYRQRGCDAIVAVGGGSPMDTAKGVNILITEEADDLMRFEGADRLKKPMKPLIVVPTTAGTGSEVTLVAVIKDSARRVKMAFTSHQLFPRVVILDPRMTLTMPPHITAATGMDALTHAMEAYTCLQKNPMSDAYAWAAVRLVALHLPQAVADGEDRQARLAMANAATMAGAAFSNSMVGMVHALGHATGAIGGLPHGVAMSIFLPFGLEYNLEKTAASLAELLLPLGGEQEVVSTPPERRAARTIVLVRQLQQRLFDMCGLPRSLREAGVAETQLEAIARLALNDGALTFNPRELALEDALVVLRQAYG
jgi:alcohol dehydrogenase